MALLYDILFGITKCQPWRFHNKTIWFLWDLSVCNVISLCVSLLSLWLHLLYLALAVFSFPWKLQHNSPTNQVFPKFLTFSYAPSGQQEFHWHWKKFRSLSWFFAFLLKAVKICRLHLVDSCWNYKRVNPVCNIFRQLSWTKRAHLHWRRGRFLPKWIGR